MAGLGDLRQEHAIRVINFVVVVVGTLGRWVVFDGVDLFVHCTKCLEVHWCVCGEDHKVVFDKLVRFIIRFCIIIVNDEK